MGDLARLVLGGPVRAYVGLIVVKNRYFPVVLFAFLILLACVIAGAAIYLSLERAGPAVEVVAENTSPTTSPQVEAPTPAQSPPASIAPASTRDTPPPVTPTPDANNNVRLPNPPAAPASATDTEQLLASIELPVRDRLDLARRFGLSGQPIPAVVNPTTPDYQAGDQETFWVGESDTLRHFQVTATLRYVGPNSYWWVEDGYDVLDSDITASAEAFENGIYPTNRDFFGSEWSPGVDNDPRVHIFIGNVPGVGGYFYSINEYSKLINPYSNEKEMFFINIKALWSGGNRLDTNRLESILAHEFQHMIHWYNDANEETWVNEGLSELAMALNEYDTGGTERVFAQTPDTQLNAWGDSPNESIAYYGGSFLFMSYFLERFGEDLMRQVVAHPDNGADGFNAVLASQGESERFDDIFADWVIANYLDDPSLGEGIWGYRNVSVDTLALDARHHEYPVSRKSSVNQYAADYIAFEDWQGSLTIEFTGTTQVRVVPDTAHSGVYQWWSNRGDDSDMTLTRDFDLSQVDEATLQFWTWYDIEADWDFAYVEVSTDGGETWDILPGRYTTTENKSGNSFGHAWTGVSGGGDTPEWVQEEIDLSAYAGQTIKIRFEYITDDAINRVGFLLDDIAIPAIDYYDDAESGDGGWLAAGFARIDNTLPQRYVVQLIQPGDKPQVQRMRLDESNRGRLTVVDPGQGGKGVVLVISGITPFTTEVAHYEYSATLK
ncbi:MAG: immune inhibitor A [Anaerolineae bacterium]